MAQPATLVKAGDIATILITIIILVIFIVGMALICYRWSLYQFDSSVNHFTGSDVFEIGTERSRSITVARGIDPAVVKSFPTFLFSEVKEQRIGKGGVECAVCLCEFEDDETLCLMPNCCHAFHVDCVSTWLSNHSTCPLCRVELVIQPGERNQLVPDPDPDLLQGVTCTNRNRPYLSMSARLTPCRVSEILFSRSHSTGHCAVQPIENFDRFKLRLPEDLLVQLIKKKTLNPVRNPRRVYRSRSVGSTERGAIYNQRNNYNNHRLHSRTFSFSDCRWANSCDRDAVAPSKSLLRSDDQV